jgi:hypothetical protein
LVGLEENVSQGLAGSTSPRKTDATSHRRHFLVAWVGAALYRFTAEDLGRAGGLARFVVGATGGLEMAQADRWVSLPQFIAKHDVKLVRGAAVAVAGALLLALASSAHAQYRGTPEMQQACTPDVMRLCQAEIPDVGRITSCMKRNRLNLSPACGAVFGVGVSRHRPRYRG